MNQKVLDGRSHAKPRRSHHHATGHLIEKLFRDARSLLIEDGTLEVLALDAARDLVQNYEHETYDLEEMMATW